MRFNEDISQTVDYLLDYTIELSFA